MKEESTNKVGLIVFPVFLIAAFFFGFLMNSDESQSKVETEEQVESINLAENETRFYTAQVEGNEEVVSATVVMDETRAELVLHMQSEPAAEYTIGFEHAVVDDNNTVTTRGNVQYEMVFTTDDEGKLILRSVHPVRVVEENVQLSIERVGGDGGVMFDFVEVE
ncbi:hypothetical protein JCM19046_1894 [Bacillus sp. JCM 19046]|nr:hypothetical protein JCM19045_689 [Bacillus sp. JCM 19045]GAF17384.1 hypothetical protein JCM19046_1894 [Bacillus sp. JCM 19046]